MARLIDWEDIRPGMELYPERYRGDYPAGHLNPILWDLNPVTIMWVKDDALRYSLYDFTSIRVYDHKRTPLIRWWQGKPSDDERRAEKWPEGVNQDG